MATAPVKSQPLHNFSLPNFLRWGAGSNSHHPRFRRSATAPADAESDRNESDLCSRAHRDGSRHGNRLLFGPGIHEKRPSQSPELDEENQKTGGRNGKISAKHDENESEADDDGEAVQRPWNLRPRRPNLAPKVGDHHEQVHPQPQTPPPAENQQPKPVRRRGYADTAASGGEKKEKRRFWIALSKEEIEEDIFVMTGSRPARRPKKRAKQMQKQLNTIFPGLWLVGASADDCWQTDAQPKRC